VLAVYGQTLHFDFVDLDDPYHVTHNPPVRAGLSLPGLRFAFGQLHAGYWIPLTWLSHMLDCQLYGLAPGGHHATNVALHALNACLAFLLLQQLGARTGPAALAASLFALHPMRVESVAWVAERKDVLSSAFGLLSLLAWLRYTRRGGALAYAMSAAALLASLLAKPMLVTLPALLLLLDAWPLRRLGAVPLPRLLLEKLPLAALAAGVAAVTFAAQRGAAAEGAFGGLAAAIPLELRLANAAVACARYLGKLAWPTQLSALYPHPYLPGGSPLARAEVMGALALLAALGAGAVALARRAPYVLVGGLWFLGTLVPVLGLVQSGTQALADRFSYFPSLGLSLLLAFAASHWLARAGPRPRGAIAAAAGLATALLVASGIASFREARHWRGAESLYQHSLASTPRNPLLSTYYGIWLQRRGRLVEASARYREASRDGAFAAASELNLGSVREAQGQQGVAAGHYARALELDPSLAIAHLRLAPLLEAAGQPEAARGHREAARQLAAPAATP
jgi:tetratricopeptide (TPR) repeat protein